MDHYHIWVNLKDTTKDVEFAKRVHAYLDHLKAQGRIESYNLARRKLGFGPPGLGEFHIEILVRDLAQLESAFQTVAARSGVVEDLHHRVYSEVTEFVSGLWRDFPDPVRVAGPTT